MNETEKVTVNLTVVDIGQIDLLVEEGLYSNRTDFVRSAIRLQFNQHRDVVKQASVRRSMVVGVLTFDREALEQKRVAGEKIAIRAIGLVILTDDIPPQLAIDVIESIKVYGSLRAGDRVREALAGRIL
ncbi:MAG: CopG family transcriptional regulator [Gemmatimonadota bacterium]